MNNSCNFNDFNSLPPFLSATFTPLVSFIISFRFSVIAAAPGDRVSLTAVPSLHNCQFNRNGPSISHILDSRVCRHRGDVGRARRVPRRHVSTVDFAAALRVQGVSIVRHDWIGAYAVADGKGEPLIG